MDLEPVVWAYRGAFGDRLVGLAVYGSAVTGDMIPGFSDVDLQVVMDGGPLTAEEAIELQRRMPEPTGFAYLQPSYQVASAPVVRVVPGAFRVLMGVIPEGFLHDEASLRATGEATVRELAALVRRDAEDWTGAIGEKRGRHVRLMTTRLKPVVRATLVALGEQPLEVWRMPWNDLVQRWKRHDERWAEELDAFLELLRATPRDERSTGEAALRLLSGLAENAAGEGEAPATRGRSEITPQRARPS